MTGQVLPVLLEVPSAIQRGLATGLYERWGGVVRVAAGRPNGGEVVTHLREVGRLGDSATHSFRFQPPPPLAASLQMTQVAAAAGVLNLGVSAVGFALTLSKLNA